MELPLRSDLSGLESGGASLIPEGIAGTQQVDLKVGKLAGAALGFSRAIGSEWAQLFPIEPSGHTDVGVAEKETARFTSILESLPLACWILDTHGRFLFANSRSRRFLGRRDAHSGALSEDFQQSQETRDRLNGFNRRALLAEEVMEALTFQVENERYSGIQFLIPFQANQRVAGAVGLFLEIILPKQDRETLDAPWAQPARFPPWALVQWDLNGRVNEWNAFAELTFGYTKDEARGKSAISLLAPTDQGSAYAEAWREVLRHGGPCQMILKSRTKFGGEIACEWCCSPLVDTAGRVTGVISFTQEVAERVKIDGQLKQSLDLESMGRLAAGVAHEFNNLLAPMVIEVEQIADHATNPTRVVSHVAALRLAIAQARELTERTQLVAGRTSEGRDWVDLNQLVESSIESLRSGIDQRIQIRLTLDRTLSRLPASRSAVLQILMNLLFNARDALSPRFDRASSPNWQAEVTVATSRFEGTNPTAPTHGASRYQVITVRDNGPGLSKVAQTHAFEPFFTTKSPGSGHGLGLALVWRLAQNHDGWVSLQSEDGNGCELRVFFREEPFGGKALQSSVIPLTAPSSSHRGIGLLLVEDNLLVANALSGVLEDRGYRIFAADTGERGWALFNEQVENLDLVLCDLNLPGISGRELLDKIQRSSRPIPVIMMSGYVAASDTRELNRLGAAALISKPIDPHELLQIVARIAAVPI